MEQDLFNTIMIFGGLWVAYKVGRMSRTGDLWYLIQRLQKHTGKTPQEIIKEMVTRDGADASADTQINTVMELHIEQGQYYAWSKGEFLAQGPDLETMFKHLKELHPNRSFTITGLDRFTEQERAEIYTIVTRTFGVR